MVKKSVCQLNGFPFSHEGIWNHIYVGFLSLSGKRLVIDSPNSQERFDIKRLILTNDKKGSKKMNT